MQPQFELSPEPLIKSGLGRLARYGTHQKTISGGPEQKYLSSDPNWNRLWRGHYSSLYAFISFKLPILKDESLKITLLHKNPTRGLKRKQVRKLCWDEISISDNIF